jgi:hypothetical protein
MSFSVAAENFPEFFEKRRQQDFDLRAEYM